MSRKVHAMHGRDHRAGGADPIPGLGGGALPVAAAIDGISSQSYTSGWQPLYDTFWTTAPTVFTAEDVSSPTFDYIGINEDGLYFAQFHISFTAAFTTSTWIEGVVEELGTPGELSALVNNTVVYDLNTPVGEQFDSGEWAHRGLGISYWFKHEAAEDGEDPFKISSVLRTSNSGTKNLGATLVVTRISDVIPTLTTSF